MSASRIEIRGVPVDCVDWPGALRVVEQQLTTSGSAGAVIAVNPEKMVRAQQDANLLACLREARLLIPDGVGVVLAARLLGLGRMQRVAGCELMPEICAAAERRQAGIFLFGASESVNARVAAVLQARFPRLCIRGRHDGYVSDENMTGIVEAINASGATILFLALGSPRQELWMQQYLPQLQHVRLCQGVGGTFDVLAGTVRRAPAAFIHLHLEWLYRLLSQPNRILRQTALPRFALQVLTAALVPSSAAPRGPAK